MADPTSSPPRPVPAAAPATRAFAPRDPRGALPPGLTAEAVGPFYRQFRADLSSKKVLATLGVRAALTGRAEQLRAALDDPAAREAATTPRGETLRPALYEAIYQWLLGTPAGERVHGWVIEPAQRVVDERTFLDPARFAAAVAEHRAALTPAGETLAPQSDAEALALFTLAFGLLQGEDGAALVDVVAGLAPAYAGFFGE